MLSSKMSLHIKDRTIHSENYVKKKRFPENGLHRYPENFWFPDVFSGIKREHWEGKG